MEKIPFTEIGLEKLKKEMSELKSIERPAVIKSIAEAREHGDLSENAEYHAAREKQGFIEGRLLELENVISRAEVIEIDRIQGNKVTFGTSIKIVDEETDEEKVLHIVGQYEANLELGKVSTSSPIVKGLIGKSVGETAEVVTPGGKKFYEVLEISVIDKSIL
ncbi:MAG: transcription elongation factor GreA [SAR116 cluster bacterium]|nr:transcription elongation factor GreA [SAR116 cluster bacterium]